VADRVWEREWLKDFHPMRFGRRLWVLPHHAEPPADPQAVLVRLDPGLAFGTGTHASTALCLTWLDARLASGSRVIDYGCGSGVLAVAAAQLGASAVHAFDIDPQALIATRDNAAANAVAARVQVHEDAATLPAEVDVVVANILAGTLVELAPRLCGLLAPGGQLILAGILKQQVHEVRVGFAPCIELAVFAERDGWSALSGRKAGP
jgi:ribosomal protein L11 methyltransferase